MQLPQGEAAPAGLFTQPDEEQDENKALRQLPKFLRRKCCDLAVGHKAENNANRNQTNRQRRDENECIPSQAHPPAHEAAEKSAEPGPAVNEGGDDNSGDERSEGIGPGRAAAGQGNDPRIPGEEIGEREECDQFVALEKGFHSLLM